jgi:hypothetical protein
MSFQLGKEKDGSPCFFVNSVLQARWNDQNKTGSFKENAKNPEKSCVVKMNTNEAGEILSSIRSRIPVDFFHKTDKGSTIIKFTPWDKDRKVKGHNGDETYKSPAFGLTIIKGSSSFKIALEAGETEILAAFMEELIRADLYFDKRQEESGQSSSGGDDLIGGTNEKTVEKENEPEDDYEDVPF